MRDKDRFLSPEHIALIKKNQAGGKNSHAKPIICTKSGKVFETTSKAAAYLGVSQGQLSNMLAGRRKNKTSLEFIPECNTKF